MLVSAGVQVNLQGLVYLLQAFPCSLQTKSVVYKVVNSWKWPCDLGGHLNALLRAYIAIGLSLYLCSSTE